MSGPVHVLAYRLGQVRQQLGFVTPLSVEERAEVAELLPEAALTLFTSMSTAGQRHSLRVCRGLRTRGRHEAEILTAALLHDVGKAAGRVPFWTRPVIVVAKRCWPRLLSRLTAYPVEESHLPGWRRALSYAWWHAEV